MLWLLKLDGRNPKLSAGPERWSTYLCFLASEHCTRELSHKCFQVLQQICLHLLNELLSRHMALVHFHTLQGSVSKCQVCLLLRPRRGNMLILLQVCKILARAGGLHLNLGCLWRLCPIYLAQHVQLLFHNMWTQPQQVTKTNLVHRMPLAKPLVVLPESKLGFGHTLFKVCLSTAS